MTELDEFIAACDRGIVEVSDWQVQGPALRAFAIAERQAGQAVPVNGPAFDAAWPAGTPDTFPAPDVFRTSGFYNRARGLLLDVLAETGCGSVPSWNGLYRLIRLRSPEGDPPNRLWLVRRCATSGGLAPVALRRNWAVEVDRALVGWERQAFRAQLRRLDGLRGELGEGAEDVLPARALGMMPVYVNDIEWRPLPPRLDADCGRVVGTEMTRQSVRSAARVLYNLGLIEGLFTDDADLGAADFVEPAMWAALDQADMALVSKALPAMQLQYRALAARSLAAVANLPDPRAPCPWHDLGETIRRIDPDIGSRLDALSPIGKRAREQGRSPRDLDQTWAVETLAAIDDGVKRNAARRGLKVMNGLRDLKDGALLPMLPQGAFDLEALGARTKRPRMPRPTPIAPSYPLDVWTNLFAAFRKDGHEPSRQLYELRRASITLGCGPEQLSRSVAEAIVEGCDDGARRALLYIGLRELDALRGSSAASAAGVDPTPVGAMRDRRRHGNVELPPRLRDELDDYQARWGYAPNACRAQRSSLAAYLSAGTRYGIFDEGPRPTLRGAVSARTLDQIEAIIADGTEELRKAHRNRLDLISNDLLLPFTPGWEAFQEALRAAGVAPSRDPTRVLLSASRCPTPNEIDDTWTQAHMATLRPDKRLAFKAALDKFEALRGMPSIAAAGLLPLIPLRPRAPKTQLGFAS